MRIEIIAPGDMTLWFRSPEVLPATMLADDEGGGLLPPDLQLSPPLEGEAVHIVYDNVPPEITAPPDVFIPWDGSIDPANTGNAVAQDAFSEVASIDYIDEAEVQGCEGYARIRRTWRAADAMGNFASAAQLITLGDWSDANNNGIPDPCETSAQPPDEETPPFPDTVAPTGEGARTPDPAGLPSAEQELLDILTSGACGSGTCGAISPALVPGLLLGCARLRLRYRRG